MKNIDSWKYTVFKVYIVLYTYAHTHLVKYKDPFIHINMSGLHSSSFFLQEKAPKFFT